MRYKPPVLTGIGVADDHGAPYLNGVVFDAARL